MTSPTTNSLSTKSPFSELMYDDYGTTFNVTASVVKNYLDGTQSKLLNFKKGYTYYYDSSDSSTSSHRFYIGKTLGGGDYTGEYTYGVIVVGQQLGN